MTAEVVFRLVSDPVLPFYPLDIALDVQNKMKGEDVHTDGAHGVVGGYGCAGSKPCNQP